jgi:hypothetical protein
LKKIYKIVPQSPTVMPTDWHLSVNHRELKKNLRNCATINDGVTDGFTNGLRTSQSARMLEAWSVGTFTDGFVGTFIDGITVGTFTDETKSLAGFSNFFGVNIN